MVVETTHRHRNKPQTAGDTQEVHVLEFRLGKHTRANELRPVKDEERGAQPTCYRIDEVTEAVDERKPGEDENEQYPDRSCFRDKPNDKSHMREG